MEEQEIKQECLKLMAATDGAYLSTIDDNGFPQTRIMGNLRNQGQCRIAEELFDGHDEDFMIYMITGHSSDKMKEIRSNEKVSVYYCDPAEFHTLLLTGTAEEVPDMDLKKRIWQDEWKMHWPGGAEDPEFVLLKMLPERAKGWYKEGAFEFKLQ